MSLTYNHNEGVKNMTLKNQNIAKANPSVIANRAFIDALYLEKYNRKATDAEYNRFKNSTVKDVSNIVLGQDLSPFTNIALGQPITPSPTPAISQPPQPSLTVPVSHPITVDPVASAPIVPATILPPSSTSNTATGQTLKAYDSSGNIVYVKPGGYNPGISLTPPPIASVSPAAPTAAEDKTIYKRKNPTTGADDLYTKIGNTYYRIPNRDKLYDLVVNQKYNDLRTELPTDAQLDTWGDIPVKPAEVPTPEIKGGGNITEQQVRDAFKAFGFEPDTGGMTDVAYWSSKPNTDLTKLYDNLRARQEKAIEDKKKADEKAIEDKKKADDEAKKATDEAAKKAEEQKKVDDAKKAEEEAAKQNSLQTIYGQTKQPVEVEELVGNFVGAAATSFLRANGISQATFDKYIKNNPTQLAKYVNMMLYGGYDKAEYLYRDLKAKELADQGNTAYQNYKAFDETIPASQWLNTPEGQKALNDTMLTPPAGVINKTLLNNTIFTIPNEAFSTLFEPIDINSPAFKAEADKIQASYYDIMTQKAQAETEQQKAVADENYKIFTADLNKKYNIQLSNNAQTAWGQLQNLFSGATQRGIGQSGLIGEAMDKYLADQRNRNQILRDEKITTQEKETLNNLLKSGSSAEIQAFVAANPAKAKQLGLVPSAEVANWYSVANLKTLYPDMTDTEINNIRNSMIDENGNYRSDLYQTLEANKYGFGQDKQTYQQQKLYEQKATEEEKAYRPYTRGNLLSSYTGVKPTPATPTTPPASTVNEPKVSVKDKKGNTILVYPSSIPDLITEGTLPAGTTPTLVSPTAPTPKTPALAPVPTPAPVDKMKSFTDWTKGQTDKLGKNWQGYEPIEGATYNTLTPEERKKKYGNVQVVGNTLYGYKY